MFRPLIDFSPSVNFLTELPKVPKTQRGYAANAGCDRRHLWVGTIHCQPPRYAELPHLHHPITKCKCFLSIRPYVS